MQDNDPSPPFPVAAGFYPGTCPFGTPAGRRIVSIAASPQGLRGGSERAGSERRGPI